MTTRSEVRAQATELLSRMLTTDKVLIKKILAEATRQVNKPVQLELPLEAETQ